MSWKNRWLPMVTALMIASAAIFAGACSGDDNGDANDAEDTASNLEQFKSSLLGTTDIVAASDDDRDELKNQCDDLAGDVDDEQVDDFCSELDDAIDDGDQQAFDQVKTVFPALEQEVRNQIGEDIADVAADDDGNGDEPLEGGDENNTGTDGDKNPDVDNPVGDPDNEN